MKLDWLLIIECILFFSVWLSSYSITLKGNLRDIFYPLKTINLIFNFIYVCLIFDRPHMIILYIILLNDLRIGVKRNRVTWKKLFKINKVILKRLWKKFKKFHYS